MADPKTPDEQYPGLGLVTMEEARAACRIDGTENDAQIGILKQAAEYYIDGAVGSELAVTTDLRVKAAILAELRLLFRPLEDTNGILRRHVTALILQIRGGA